MFSLRSHSFHMHLVVSSYINKVHTLVHTLFSACNCSVPSQLRVKMHSKSPSVMAFCLVCLGILAKNMPKRLAGYYLLNSYVFFNIYVLSILTWNSIHTIMYKSIQVERRDLMLAIFLAPIYILLNIYVLRWGYLWIGNCHHLFQSRIFRIILTVIYTLIALTPLTGFLIQKPAFLHRILKITSNYFPVSYTHLTLPTNSRV